MMDPLKLLTRSSKLQKKLGAAKSSTRLHTPSETPTTNGTSDHVRGKKRKRSDRTPRAEACLDSVGADNSLMQYGVKEGESAVFILPSEEDARTILKKHKLKVSILKRKRTASGHHTILEQITTKPIERFHDLNGRYNLSKRLAGNLANQGYTRPTEVQMVALPLLCGSDYERGTTESPQLKDKSSSVDLITVAPTGSGKTLAFLVPIINGLLASKARQEDDNNPKYVKAIILAPTHELVGQIVNEGKKLTMGIGLRIAALRKHVHVAQTDVQDAVGVDVSDDDSEAEEKGDGEQVDEAGETSKSRQTVKADIVVTTPSQLLNSLKEEDDIRDLPSIEYLVLDEADVLLDKLFRDETLAVWATCTSPKLRCSLWSATIGASIEDLAQDIIIDRREKLALSDAHHIVRVVVGLKDSALPTIAHRLVYGGTEHGKLIALRNILQPSSGIAAQGQATLRPPFIVFTQTISRAIALHSELIYEIPMAAGGSSRLAVIHSDLSDNARAEIMARFRKGEIWVLITTDLLSRGIDFRGINGVVNYDIPTTAASYVHRAGRTGRAGREGGVAITLYTEEDIKYIRNIANVIAASEKLRKTTNGAGPKSQLEPWLLASLPDVSKKSKRDLKTRGVESRRPVGKDGPMTLAQKKSRISTKSGYERQRENRRKDARKASRRRAAEGNDAEADDGEDVFSGFD